MVNNLAVSIIIPVYNGQLFLEETILSVIDQTHSLWELILIDDGSTDQSYSICEKYELLDERIKAFSKLNGGQGAARNYGIEKASNNYISFLDADDLWKKNKLEVQLDYFKKNKNLDVIFSPGEIFYTGSKKRELFAWKTGELYGFEWLNELYERSGIINSSVILKQSCLQKLRFDESPNIRGSEDWDLWLRLAFQGCNFCGTTEYLVFYREHSQGVHHDKFRMFKGKEQVYKKHNNTPDIPELRKLKQWRYVYRELMNYTLLNKQEQQINSIFNSLKKVDKWGFGTLLQQLIIPIFGVHSFLWISNKIIYRLAYRIERLNYYFNLKKNQL